MSNPSDFPGLDYDFMRYIGVQSETQREIQSYYLPYFENRQKILDLACGDADFVALLHEQGIDVTGVDSETKPVEKAQAQGLPVVENDVFAFLSQCADNTYDGIFCAHLVEHLPYPKIIELLEEAYRVLQPGGLILLVTPNVRSLFSHLEMFYMHYDHVTFCHPKLLSFFLDRADYEDIAEGTNPKTGSPLMGELNHLHLPEIDPAPPEEQFNKVRTYYEEVYQGVSSAHNDSGADVGLLRRMLRGIKNGLAYLFVRPFVDRLALNTFLALHKVSETQTAHQIQLAHDLRQMRTALSTLNGPFECYVVAHKPNI